MRTNIEIDDTLMDYVMATGEFKTKREAVEAGLQLIKRRKAYAAIRAARGTLFWDDSDDAWARRRAELAAEDAAQVNNGAGTTDGLAGLAVHEPEAVDKVAQLPSGESRRKPPTSKGRASSALKVITP